MGRQEEDTARLDQPEPDPRHVANQAAVDQAFSPAQRAMRSDATILSREGTLMRLAEAEASAIVLKSDLPLTPSQWRAVEALVRQAVDAGILLERST